MTGWRGGLVIVLQSRIYEVIIIESSPASRFRQAGRQAFGNNDSHRAEVRCLGSYIILWESYRVANFVSINESAIV